MTEVVWLTNNDPSSIPPTIQSVAVQKHTDVRQLRNLFCVLEVALLNGTTLWGGTGMWLPHCKFWDSTKCKQIGLAEMKIALIGVNPGTYMCITWCMVCTTAVHPSAKVTELQAVYALWNSAHSQPCMEGVRSHLEAWSASI